MADFYLMHQEQPVAILNIADILELKAVLDKVHFPLSIAPIGSTPDVLSFRKW